MKNISKKILNNKGRNPTGKWGKNKNQILNKFKITKNKK
jgi:hypothetical protein